MKRESDRDADAPDGKKIKKFQEALQGHLNTVGTQTGRPLVVQMHQFAGAARISKSLLVANRQCTVRIWAWDMGTGKTVASAVLIAFLSRIESRAATLVVAPLSMLESWRTALLEWLPLSEETDLVVARSVAHLQNGADLSQAKVVLLTKECLVGCFRAHYKWNPQASDYVATNGRSYFRGAYERQPGTSPHSLFSLAERNKFHCFIGDEIHEYKNPKTWWAAASKAVASQCKVRIGLTGTPVCNSPLDLPGILQALGVDDGEVVDQKLWKGVRLDAELVRNVQRRYIDRVLRDSIRPSLPPRTDVPIVYDAAVSLQCNPPPGLYDDLPRERDIRAGNRLVQLYNHRLGVARRAVKEMQDEQGSQESFKTLMKALAFLRAMLWSVDWALVGSERFLKTPGAVLLAAAQPTATVTALRTAVLAAQGDGHSRVVVYNPYVTALRIAEAHFKMDGACGETFLFHGKLTAEGRSSLLNNFLKCEKGVLLLSPAGGLGLTICPGCEVMIFSGYPFSPQELEQAACRVWRIKQTEPVHFYHLVAQGSIHTAMREMYEDKVRLEDAVLNSASVGDKQWKQKASLLRMMRTADSAGNLVGA